MAPELHGRVRSLFDEALERPEADRISFLRSVCSGEPELLQAVLRLLEAHRRSQNFLEEETRSKRRIGRYLITGELGRGAMGVVYDAIDPLIGRKVAVKVIHLPAVADSNEARFLRDRLFREARSAGLLSHPGIVSVFDMGQEGDLAFIAMERVEGVSLYQMLASGPGLSRGQALDILMQTAAALDHAHRSGVVHRDIKPANIIVDNGGKAKIADFGIAKIISTDRYTATGVVMGTPSYMSPEQIEAQPSDGRADQFSLAVVAYELLTGRRPFHADSLATLVHMIVYAERPSAHAANPGLPPAVDEVLRRGLARFPNDRYPSSTHFVRALEEASNGVWRAPPTPQPVASLVRKTLLIRALAGAAVVLLALFTGFIFYNLFPPKPRQTVTQVTKKPVAQPSAVRPKASGSGSHPGKAPLAKVDQGNKAAPLVRNSSSSLQADGQIYLWIPPGTFTMGCSEGDTECYADEKPPHPERIVNGFWLGQTEVTQAAYQRVRGGNPSGHKGAQLPVENVSWDDAMNYCSAIGGRLPTEAEWEYAARGHAGITPARYGSLDAVAWHPGNSGAATHPVAQKQPNAFGLYDMLGNVWEWVEDSYSGGLEKIERGGSSGGTFSDVRASRRGKNLATHGFFRVGFRCAGAWPAPRKPPLSAGAPVPGTAGPDGVYIAGNGVSQPKLARKVEPEYDEADRQAKIRGVVDLRIVIDADGNVASTKVVKSLTPGLDERAAEAVRQWKFEPARKDGKPVPVAATVEVNFRLL